MDKLPADAKSRLDSALEAGKAALRTGEADGIKTALEELNAAYSAAGAAMYQSQAAEAGPSGEPSPQADGTTAETPAEGDVVEADYEIVDENK